MYLNHNEPKQLQFCCFPIMSTNVFKHGFDFFKKLSSIGTAWAVPKGTDDLQFD